MSVWELVAVVVVAAATGASNREEDVDEDGQRYNGYLDEMLVWCGRAFS